jgi:hypothetical protein
MGGRTGEEVEWWDLMTVVAGAGSTPVLLAMILDNQPLVVFCVHNPHHGRVVPGRRQEPARGAESLLDSIPMFHNDGTMRKRLFSPLSVAFVVLLASCTTDTDVGDPAEEDTGLPSSQEPDAGSGMTEEDIGAGEPIFLMPDDCTGFADDLREFGDFVGFDTLENADERWSSSGVPEEVDVEELGAYRLCLHGLSQSGFFRIFRFQEASLDQWMGHRQTLYQEGFRDITVNGYDGVYLEYALDPTGESENIVFPTQSPDLYWDYWEAYFYKDGWWLWAEAGESEFSADDPYVVLLKYLN